MLDQNSKYFLATISFLLSIVFACIFLWLSSGTTPVRFVQLLLGIMPNFIASLLTFVAIYMYLDSRMPEDLSHRTLLEEQQKSLKKYNEQILQDLNKFHLLSPGFQKNETYFGNNELRNMQQELELQFQKKQAQINDFYLKIETEKNSAEKEKLKTNLTLVAADIAAIKEKLDIISAELSILKISEDNDALKANNKKAEALLIEQQNRILFLETQLLEMDALRKIALKEAEYLKTIEALEVSVHQGEAQRNALSSKLKTLSAKENALLQKNQILADALQKARDLAVTIQEIKP